MDLVPLISDFILYGFWLLVAILSLSILLPKFRKKRDMAPEVHKIDLKAYRQLLRARNDAFRDSQTSERIDVPDRESFSRTTAEINFRRTTTGIRTTTEAPERYQIVNNNFSKADLN